MTNLAPKLSKVFAAVFALVIALNLFLVSLVAGECFIDSGALVFGVFILPFCGWFAAIQYRGAFRGVACASRVASVLLYIGSGLMLLGVFATSTELIVSGSFHPLPAAEFFAYLVVGAFGVAAARMNAVWSERVRDAVALGWAPPPRDRYTPRELLGGAAVFALMAGVATSMVLTEPPHYAEHIDASQAPFDLPPGAKDVCYHFGIRTPTAYEFTTDETSFLAWATAEIEGWDPRPASDAIQEIVDPARIARYVSRKTTPAESWFVTISNGLHYSRSSIKDASSDISLEIAFDRTTNRAYYFFAAN